MTDLRKRRGMASRESSVSVECVDANVRAYLIELASCVSLALKFRRTSARVCPEDGCMSRRLVGIRRTTQTCLGVHLISVTLSRISIAFKPTMARIEGSLSYHVARIDGSRKGSKSHY